MFLEVIFYLTLGAVFSILVKKFFKQNETQWVDLTDEEMLMIYGQKHEGKKYSLGRMVQQALKEKNT
jgi:hypothetical protein